jgi:hypothetical protein
VNMAINLRVPEVASELLSSIWGPRTGVLLWAASLFTYGAPSDERTGLFVMF